MSALTELRGLSLITMKICSSFSKLIKFPNHDFLANLGARNKIIMWEETYKQTPFHLKGLDILRTWLRGQTGHIFWCRNWKRVLTLFNTDDSYHRKPERKSVPPVHIALYYSLKYYNNTHFLETERWCTCRRDKNIPETLTLQFTAVEPGRP